MLPDDEGGPPGYKAFGTVSDGGVQKTVWGRSFPRNDNTCYVDWVIQASWKDVQGAQWNGGKQLDEASAKAIVVKAFGHDSTGIIKTEKANRSSMEIEKQPKLEPSSPTTITSPTPGGRPALGGSIKQEFDEIDSDSAFAAALPISGHSEPSEHYHERGVTTLRMANTRAWVNEANNDSGSGIGTVASMPNTNGPASVGGNRHSIDTTEETSPPSNMASNVATIVAQRDQDIRMLVKLCAEGRQLLLDGRKDLDDYKACRQEILELKANLFREMEVFKKRTDEMRKLAAELWG